MYVITTVNAKKILKPMLLCDSNQDIRQFETHDKALEFCMEFAGKNKTYCNHFIREYDVNE